MLRKLLKILSGASIIFMFMAGCGTTPNDHNINENNQEQQPPMNEDNRSPDNDFNDNTNREENIDERKEQDFNDDWDKDESKIDG